MKAVMKKESIEYLLQPGNIFMNEEEDTILPFHLLGRKGLIGVSANKPVPRGMMGP